MTTQLGTILLYSPIFLLPAAIAIGFGVWLGNVYIKVQLPVKREMSNCKAPVLAMFGSAIHGISKSCRTNIQGTWLIHDLSICPGIWGTGSI